MRPHLRKAIAQLTVIVTMATTSIVAIPLVSKYAQQRVEQAVRAAPPGKAGSQAFTAAIFPQVFAVFGCLVFSLVVGVVVSETLPPAHRQERRGRRT